MLTRGVLRNCVDAVNDMPVVIRASGGNSIAGKDLSNEGITLSMKEAVRLNASAVALSIYIGTDHEHQTLINLSRLIDEGEEYGIPVLAVTAVGKELVNRAYLQIVLVVLGIVLYIAYSFRKVSEIAKEAKISSWKLGFAVIITLAHNLIITVGLFVVLGRYKSVDVDSLFVTALLTVFGYSVHDTIVVFDRIRESLGKYKFKPLDKIIDFSIYSTLARSINTGSSLIFVMIALLLFGAGTIFYFVLALLVGVVVGTYSSIFIASPILYLWQKR